MLLQQQQQQQLPLQALHQQPQALPELQRLQLLPVVNPLLGLRQQQQQQLPLLVLLQQPQALPQPEQQMVYLLRPQLQRPHLQVYLEA